MELQPRDDLRVSDADRERVVARLSDHLAAGRLTVDEFSDRVSGALAARTAGDLSGALRELPQEDQPPPAIVAAITEEQRKRRWRRWRNDIGAFVTTNGTCVGIWGLMGADSRFWPRWVRCCSPASVWQDGSSQASRRTRRRRESRPPRLA